MQDSALLISGSINAANVIVAQSASGLNAVTLSAHSIDLGSARDIGEGHGLFLKVIAASGASAVASANYTDYSNATSYVRGEKCSSGGIDYNCILANGGHAAYVAETNYVIGNKCSYGGKSYICILATVGHLPTNDTYWEEISPPNATYWEVVPDSIEIQLISATNAALTTGVSVLATTGAITVYPPYNKDTDYVVGDKCTNKVKNYKCILDIPNTVPAKAKVPPNETYWDEIGTGISDGLVAYLPVPVQVGSKGKRYLGARYITVGNVFGASFISELTTEISDPEKYYPSGFTVNVAP